MTEKQTWERYCIDHPDEVPIFISYQWMQASGFAWEIKLYMEKENLIAVFVYACYVKWSFKILTNPPFSPYGGVYFTKQNWKNQYEYHNTCKMASRYFIDNLPNHAFIDLKFHPSIQDIQTFKWMGYKVDIRSTYQIDTTSAEDQMFASIEAKQRNNIKSALEHLTVVEHDNFDLHFDLVLSSFEKADQSSVITKRQLEKIKSDGRFKLYKIGLEDKTHSSLLIVEDDKVIYLLSHGIAKDGHRGANAALIWHAIKYAKSRGKLFDFEGSDLERVERFYRSFGGRLQAYYEVSKYNSSIYKMIRSIKS
jgi:lipid II:glycine glycyltransferase (peptidoglycan interpeptide bridge formation enzyme)